MTQDLELRVLTGLHHGARCAARDGALMGSHARCDVVLYDNGIAEEAVRLWIGDGTWRLSAHDDPTDTTPELPFGTSFPLGPIHVTVAHPADPWPDPAELSAMAEPAEGSRNDSAHDAMHEPALEETRSPPATARDNRSDTTPHQPGRLAAQQEDAFHPAAARRRKGTGLRWAVGGMLIVLVFGSVASFSPTGVRSSPRMETGPTADGDTLSNARRLLLAQGYSDRVHATLTSDQEVLVTGWVRDDAEHDRLATALSTIWPLPALRVDNEMLVAARIASRVQDLDVRVVVDYPGPGRVTIRGIAASDAVRAEAFERWRADADTPSQVAITLLLATQVGDALNEAVAAAGLPPAVSTWKGKTLRVEPRGFDAAQRERLRAILDALNQTYMNALLISEDETPGSTSIPFRVHSVVGGEQPWVMLEDGTRIVEGGSHGAYRLKSIEDSSVVFDGPTTAVIPR